MPTAFISSVKLKINMKKLFPDTFISDAISMKFQMMVNFIFLYFDIW